MKCFHVNFLCFFSLVLENCGQLINVSNMTQKIHYENTLCVFVLSVEWIRVYWSGSPTAQKHSILYTVEWMGKDIRYDLFDDHCLTWPSRVNNLISDKPEIWTASFQLQYLLNIYP